MIVVSTGTSATCLGAFLAAIFDGCFLLALGFGALLPTRRTFDFALFGVERFAAFLRAGLALVLPRFQLFLRAATPFFDLAIAISCEVCRRKANFDVSELCYLTLACHAGSLEACVEI
jgi:hypothetical protein